ncbi:MAG: hypothetical protein K8R92_10820 [Planctomycetes bacterium]|nr:hypothetical protein [Planctomycetota bacterium]
MTQNFSEVDDPYLPPAASKWPAVIGWILLAWCGLGVCFEIYGFTAGKSLSTETYLGLPDWMIAAIRMLTILGAVGTALGLAAGWLLRKRQRRGFMLTKLWVLFSLVLGVAWMAVEIGGREEMTELIKRNYMKEMEKSPQPAPQMTPEMFKGIFIAQLGCIGIFAFVPPIVIGALLLSKRRREETATWPA